MSQFLSNVKETKDRHFGELENATTDAEKANASNDNEGSTKPEESISEIDSEVFRMRSRRTYFTTQQKEALERTFSTTQYINPKQREVLASSIGVSDRVVQTWFKNRRVKWRKEQRRTQFKVFVEPPQPIDQLFVLMPHIAYPPINYYNYESYYEQKHPNKTSPPTVTTTSTYHQNSIGENNFQNGGFFAWDKDAFN